MIDSRAVDAIYSVRECTRCGNPMVPEAAQKHRRSWRCPFCGKTAR